MALFLNKYSIGGVDYGVPVAKEGGMISTGCLPRVVLSGTNVSTACYDVTISGTPVSTVALFSTIDGTYDLSAVSIPNCTTFLFASTSFSNAYTASGVCSGAFVSGNLTIQIWRGTTEIAVYIYTTTASSTRKSLILFYASFAVNTLCGTAVLSNGLNAMGGYGTTVAFADVVPFGAVAPSSAIIAGQDGTITLDWL